METLYLSTFITGFSDVVESQLRKSLKDIQIDLILDGLLLYHSPATVNQVRQLRFFNNTFVVLKFIKGTSSDPLRAIVVEALKQTNVEQQLLATLPHRQTTFRIKTFVKNQPTAIDPELLTQLERQLSKIHYLRLDKSKPQLEFWCFTRSEGYSFFAVKVTKNENYEKTLQKGELQPKLANLLCLLSEPKASDAFLDPFAGHGSIPFERARMLPANKIIAGEQSLALTQKLQERSKSVKQPVTVVQFDALHTQLNKGAVNKIVTDPPWGIFEKDLDIHQLYTAMLAEFIRILSHKGIAVILTAQKDILEQVIRSQAALKIVSTHSTLVSGKKAGVFKVVKV